MMRDLFFITSAINNDYGLFDRDQKMQQTLESIQSIHVFHNDHDIILGDASKESLTTDQINKLREAGAEVFCCQDDLAISLIVDSSPNQEIAKTFGELVIWSGFLRNGALRANTYHRLYKLSGRYRLNQYFDQTQHTDKKVVMAPPIIWQWSIDDPEKTCAVGRTRLWSCPWQYIPHLRDTWIDVEQRLQDSINKNSQVLMIEALLFWCLSDRQLTGDYLAPIGVEGLFGQDGKFIRE